MSREMGAESKWKKNNFLKLNWWLGDDPFLLGFGLFSKQMVIFREGIKISPST